MPSCPHPLCQSKRCPVDRRPYPPGQHGHGRILRATIYPAPREAEAAHDVWRPRAPVSPYYKEAARRPGITGDNLLQLLEQRLDNVVWRAGLAATRPQARQLVNHGHFQVNGRKVDIPSYQVRPGDVVTLKDKSKDAIVIQHAVDTQGREAPAWLHVDLGERKVDVTDHPQGTRSTQPSTSN